MLRLRYKRLVILLIITFLFYTFLPVSYGNSTHNKILTLMPEEAQKIYESLLKYENYVRNLERQDTGYVMANGYPMYLYTFGMMYYRLHLLDPSKTYYETKFLNAASIAHKKRNDECTWTYFDGQSYHDSPTALYNCLFSDLFIRAYEVSGNSKYLKWAESTLNKLPYFLYNSSADSVYNLYFQMFIAIAQYLDKSTESNTNLMNAGKLAFKKALRGYDKKSKRWYYSPLEFEQRKYDGHSANYQLAQIENFLIHKKSIMSIFPDQYEQFYNEIPTMLAESLKYQLPSGAFYYNESAPDSTETIGIVLSALTLIDEEYKSDHSRNISKSIKTLMERQAKNGAFYKTKSKKKVEIWYGDDLASRIPIYLLGKKQQIEKNDLQFYSTQSLKEDKMVLKDAVKNIFQGKDGNTNNREKVLTVLEWISTNLEWENFGDNSATQVYQSRKAVCGGATTLFIEFCRYLNIPARRVVLDNLNPTIDNGLLFNGHTTAEVWLCGRWSWFDPQYGLFCTKNGSIEGDIVSAEELYKKPILWLKGGFVPFRNVHAYESGDLQERKLSTVNNGNEPSGGFIKSPNIIGNFNPYQNFSYCNPMYVDGSFVKKIFQPLAIDANKGTKIVIGDEEGENLTKIQVNSLQRSYDFGNTGVNISNFGVDSAGFNRDLLVIIENAMVNSNYDLDLRVIGNSGGDFRFSSSVIFGAVNLKDNQFIVPYRLPYDIKLSFRALRPTMIICLSHNYSNMPKLIQISRITLSSNSQ